MVLIIPAHIGDDHTRDPMYSFALDYIVTICTPSQILPPTCRDEALKTSYASLIGG